MRKKIELYSYHICTRESGRAREDCYSEERGEWESLIDSKTFLLYTRKSGRAKEPGWSSILHRGERESGRAVQLSYFAQGRVGEPERIVTVKKGESGRAGEPYR